MILQFSNTHRTTLLLNLTLDPSIHHIYTPIEKTTP